MHLTPDLPLNGTTPFPDSPHSMTDILTGERTLSAVSTRLLVALFHFIFDKICNKFTLTEQIRVQVFQNLMPSDQNFNNSR